MCVCELVCVCVSELVCVCVLVCVRAVCIITYLCLLPDGGHLVPCSECEKVQVISPEASPPHNREQMGPTAAGLGEAVPKTEPGRWLVSRESVSIQCPF